MNKKTKIDLTLTCDQILDIISYLVFFKDCLSELEVTPKGIELNKKIGKLLKFLWKKLL